MKKKISITSMLFIFIVFIWAYSRNSGIYGCIFYSDYGGNSYFHQYQPFEIYYEYNHPFTYSPVFYNSGHMIIASKKSSIVTYSLSDTLQYQFTLVEASKPISYERTNIASTDSMSSSLTIESDPTTEESIDLQYPKPIPHTNKISFVENSKLHIADLYNKEITTIDEIYINSEYVWLNKDTLLYSEYDLNNGSNIKKYDIVSKHKTLFEENAFAPSVSACGDYISYLKDLETAIIMCVYPGRENTTSITIPKNLTKFNIIATPKPSPDGKYLLYGYNQDPSSRGVAITEISTNKTKILNKDIDVYTVDWNNEFILP